MKKWWVLLVSLLLFGCSAGDFETIADSYTPLPQDAQAQMVLSFDQDAQAGAMESETQENLYFCDGFTMTTQTLESGDLDRTLRAVTGFGRDQLTLLQQTQGDCTRYDFVWTCAGEGGDQVCRGSILDDGSYHYVVATMADDEVAGGLTATWNSIFSSFNIEPVPADTAP